MIFDATLYFRNVDHQLASSIHLICRRVGFELKGVTQIDKSQKLFLSVSWELSSLEASELIGGWVYFHATKDTRSEFGGVITRTEVLHNLSSHGNPEIGIVFQARTEARNQKWRGHLHRMAWSSGMIPLTLPHEIPL